MIPAPPVLTAALRAHHAAYGIAPDGRLFRGHRGGPLSESVYGRAWQAARILALGPELVLHQGTFALLEISSGRGKAEGAGQALG